MKFRKATAKNGGWTAESMVRVVDGIKNKILSESCGNHSTLHKKVVKARQSVDGTFKSKAYASSSMNIFTKAEEEQLKDYCIKASKMGYGLSPVKRRSLAFEFAIKLGKRLPHSRKGRSNP